MAAGLPGQSGIAAVCRVALDSMTVGESVLAQNTMAHIARGSTTRPGFVTRTSAPVSYMLPNKYLVFTSLIHLKFTYLCLLFPLYFV